MTVHTFYLLSSLAENSAHLAMQDGGTAPTTATTATGWRVGTLTPPNYARMNAGVERLAASFSTTPQPDSAPSAILGDCFRIPQRLKGDFAAGDFVCSFPVIADSSGGNQDGRIRLRLWRARLPGGTFEHEIASGAVQGTIVTNLATSAQQISTVTVSLPAFSLAREFLFFQVAWEITGAGSTTTRDVLLRVGADANIVTPDLTPTTYDLWQDDQLLDDYAEYLAAQETAKANFSANNQALLNDPTNATLRAAYTTLDVARDAIRIDFNPILAKMIERGIEVL